MTRFSLLCAGLAALIVPLAMGHAEPATDPFPSPEMAAACSGPEFRALDGWIGQWQATDVATGTDAGRADIRRALGGCVIIESWNGLGGDGEPYDGFGVHRYDPASKSWHQDWFGDQADNLNSDGKMQEGGGVIYERRFTAPSGEVWARQVIVPLPDGRFSNRGERSTDGGKTWQPTFNLTYTRDRP